MSDETYRMLGQERHRDLERHAVGWQLAKEARNRHTHAEAEVQKHEPPQERTGLLALFVRLARASG